MIDWINTIAVSVSMSVDCMTIGAVDGIQEPGMKKRKVLFIAFVFGFMQSLMPIIGYFIGYLFREQLEKYIPWIAFALLTFLAVKNIVEFFKDKAEKKKEAEEKTETENTENCKESDSNQTETPKVLNLPSILIQGVATSIDALCIGFVYLDYDIPSAMIVFGVIGVVTFLLSCLTITFGRKVGGFLENWAGLIAGIVFFAIGLKILIQSFIEGNSTEAASLLTYLINVRPWQYFIR